MPSKLAGATKRLRKAQANFVKVHKAHARKKASGSSVGGRTRRRRKRGGAVQRTMGIRTGKGWKLNRLRTQLRQAQTNLRAEANRRAQNIKTAALGGRVRRRR